MPTSTFTLTKDVPTALADTYGLPANKRTAGSVLSLDHEFGLNLIRQGYAQAGNYAAPAGGLPANDKIQVQLIATVPDPLANDIGLGAGAGRQAGAVVMLWPDRALQLVRAGLASFTDVHGAGSTGKNPHSIASATLTFAAVAAGAQAELTVPVAGAAVGDPVVVGAPAGLNAGLVVNGRVSAAGVVTVRVVNTSGASVTPGAGTWKVAVVKF